MNCFWVYLGIVAAVYGLGVVAVDAKGGDGDPDGLSEQWRPKRFWLGQGHHRRQQQQYREPEKGKDDEDDKKCGCPQLDAGSDQTSPAAESSQRGRIRLHNFRFSPGQFGRNGHFGGGFWRRRHHKGDNEEGKPKCVCPEQPQTQQPPIPAPLAPITNSTGPEPLNPPAPQEQPPNPQAPELQPQNPPAPEAQPPNPNAPEPQPQNPPALPQSPVANQVGAKNLPEAVNTKDDDEADDDFATYEDDAEEGEADDDENDSNRKDDDESASGKKDSDEDRSQKK